MKRLISIMLALVLAALSMPCQVLAEVAIAPEQTCRYNVLVVDVSGKQSFHADEWEHIIDSTLTGGLLDGLDALSQKLVDDIIGTTSPDSIIYTADSAVAYVRTAALAFMRDILSAPGENYVAIVTYDSSARVLVDFTDDFESATQLLSGIQESVNSRRSIFEGLKAAKSLLDQIDDPAAAKNVVLATTGITDVGDSTREGSYDDQTVGSTWVNLDTSIPLYAYANSALEVAEQIRSQSNTSIYVLGLFQTMKDMPEEGRDVADFFQVTARDLASSPYHFFNVTSPEELEFFFGDIAGDIVGESNPMVHGHFQYRGNLSEALAKQNTEADYFYTDDYFFRDSSVLDWSLASMSLALELSSWSSLDFESDWKVGWYDPGLDPADADYYRDRLANAKTLLLGSDPKADSWTGIGDLTPEETGDWQDRGLGFRDFDANEDWQNVPGMNTIGVCAARKDIQKHGDSYTLVAVVVRGGGYFSEWGGNFAMGASGDHTGFTTAKNKALDWLNRYLAKLRLQSTDKLKLWIVGYSRAGITANLLAGAIDENPEIIRSGSLKREDLYCYTFEAPQGVLGEHTDDKYTNIHNIRSLIDIVPMVPPSVWGFNRYNNTRLEGVLPNPYTMDTKRYEELKGKMLLQLEALHLPGKKNSLWNTEKNYKLYERFRVPRFIVDLTKPAFQGGLTFDWVEADMGTTVQKAIDYVFDSLIMDRRIYNQALETTVCNILSGIKSTGGKELFLKCFFDQFSPENLCYILEPLVWLNPNASQAERSRAMQERLNEVAEKSFVPYGYTLDTSELSAFFDGVTLIVRKLIFDTIISAIFGTLDEFSSVAELACFAKKTDGEFHWADIILAWVQTMDPNFNKDLADYPVGMTTRVVRINCPVDIEIRDREDMLVASFVGSEMGEGSDSLVYYVNPDGERMVFLPGDADYSIEMVGTDAGTVNVSLGEYDFQAGCMTRLDNYFDVPVQQDTRLEMEIPAMQQEGASIYALRRDGEAISPSESLQGSAAAEARYAVTVHSEGNGGYGLGGGTYVRGSFASVRAYMRPRAEFLGWYVGDTRVADTQEYRFSVQETVDLTARFSTVNVNRLQVLSGPGGSVDPIEDYFCPDTVITLSAEPEEGCRFAGWTQEGEGNLKDPQAMNTTFLMGDSQAVLTARFVLEIETDSTGLIRKQPADQQIPAGGSAIFSIEVSDGCQCQWYARPNENENWTRLEKRTDASLELQKVGAELNSYQFICMVSDDKGNSETSDVARLQVNVSQMPASPNQYGAPDLMTVLQILALIAVLVCAPIIVFCLNRKNK